jgi:hypothetical protein
MMALLLTAAACAKSGYILKISASTDDPLRSFAGSPEAEGQNMNYRQELKFR